MRKVGVLGGSFNPIHLGHLSMALHAIDAFGLDEMLLLPTGNPPHKRLGLADKLDRLEMVRLTAKLDPRLRVCDAEVTREGVIYTVDTLHILLNRMPDAHIYYVIGADTLLDMHTWKCFKEVIRLCSFAVCGRPGSRSKEVISCMENMRRMGADMLWFDMPPEDISSTMVRRKAEQGSDLAGLVAPEVAAYIRGRGLYAKQGETP